MGKRVHYIRTVSETEEHQLRTLANSRTQPHRIVQRAQLLVTMIDDSQLTASKAALQVGFKNGVTGAQWVQRFNDEGLEGIADKPRSGAPTTHSIEVRSRLIDLAMHKPSSLDYPFELWTLERLQISFKEREGIYLSESRICTWIKEEGLNWKRQQSWFHNAEKQDDQFVEKRGPSFWPTRCLHQA